MEDGWQYQRVVAGIVAALALIAGVVLVVINLEYWPFSVGLVWGMAGGLFGHRMNCLAIARYLKNPDQPPTIAGFKWFMGALVTLGVALATNKLSGVTVFSPYTVAAGIFLPNLVLMVDGFIRRPEALDQAADKKEDSGEA